MAADCKRKGRQAQRGYDAHGLVKHDMNVRGISCRQGRASDRRGHPGNRRGRFVDCNVGRMAGRGRGRVAARRRDLKHMDVIVLHACHR